MKFSEGNRVKLNRDMKLQNGTLPEGTKGIITTVNPISETYNVNFDTGQKDVRTLESFLELA